METQVSSKSIQYTTGEKKYEFGCTGVGKRNRLDLHYPSLKAAQFNAKSPFWSMISTMGESENV